MTGPALLSVEGVSVDLPTPRGNLRAVDQVDLSIGAGRTLGIVGESGCGKTMLSRAILQLLPKKAKLSGRVMFDGQDLVRLDRERLRKLRGRSLAVVFQDPMTSLNPVLTIGTQLIETLQEHLELDGPAAKMRSIELLAAVGIPAPEQRLMQYPHQLSGGMRQRVAIAIALSCEPKLLIADEPTTALDVTIQAQILDLLAREQRRRHMAMIIITHDLGVVAGRTDEVAVMYAGRVVERAPTPDLFKKMRMPYTEALLAAIPKIDAKPHTPLPAISGRPPDPTRPLQGCSFSPRCRYAWAQCQIEKPRLEDGGIARAPICLLPSARHRSRRSRMMQSVSQSVSGDPLLRVENLVVEYPVGQQDGPCGVRRQPRDRARRDARPGRRIRLRKIDARPRGDAVAQAGVGQGAVRRPGPHGDAGRYPAADAPARAADLPGPDRLAEPAAADRRHHRRTAGDIRRQGSEEARAAGP